MHRVALAASLLDPAEGPYARSERLDREAPAQDEVQGVRDACFLDRYSRARRDFLGEHLENRGFENNPTSNVI